MDVDMLELKLEEEFPVLSAFLVLEHVVGQDRSHV